jgi:hypothetical protein
MTASSTPIADNTIAARGHEVHRRLQLWGGGAAILGTLLGLAPQLLLMLPMASPLPLGQVATIAGGLLMVVAAVLLAKAFVGDRAPFGLAKLGGILLILFHCWWLAVLLVPTDLWLFGATGGEVWNVMRAVIGVAAGVAIATSWPARGFNRWSMLIVAACFGLAIYGAYALIIGLGQAGADGALLLSYLQPLSLLAFGAGHAISGWRAVRATGADASA